MKLKNVIIISFFYLGFLLLSLRSLYFGGIAFWFDPARDLLNAWNNLHKLTLIGQSSGIPGFFYGPFWIWWLSMAMVVSKNPAIIAFIALTIPYFVIFPYLLWQFRKFLGWGSLFVLLGFYGYYLGYTNSIWNPHLSPLIILGILFSVYKSKFFILGILIGLLSSFHFSMFIGLLLASFIYLIITRSFKQIVVFSLAVSIMFLPTLVFDFRHSFMQSQTILNAVISSVIYNHGVVGQKGLNFEQIIGHFYWFGAIIPFAIIFWKRFELAEKRTLLFGILSLICLAVAYLSTKNPVWDYHFIGFEILYLFLFAAILSRSKVALLLSIIYLGYAAIYQFVDMVRDYPPKYHLVPGLKTKTEIVKTILDDAKDEPFEYFAYDSGIYTYDYDYLFKWLSSSNRDSATIYLIIPPVSKAVNDDFIYYRSKNYETEWQKTATDGTKIIKRVVQGLKT